MKKVLFVKCFEEFTYLAVIYEEFMKMPCANGKECSNYRTTAVMSNASKVMLKILQARIQQYMNHELPMFKMVLEKAEKPEIKLPTSAGSSKKQESSRKTSISALLTMPKPYQTTWPASWETCMQVRKQQLELDMEQQTGSK